jgi:hypothetical protein
LTESVSGLLNTPQQLSANQSKTIEYNGVAKAKGLENFVPTKWGGKISLLADNAGHPRAGGHTVGAKRQLERWSTRSGFLAKWVAPRQPCRFPNRQPAHPGAVPLGVRLLWRTGAVPLWPRFLDLRRRRLAPSALYLPPLLHAELHPFHNRG